MLKKDKYDEIFSFLEDKKNILIAGHRNPDGDSVSAIIATRIYLLSKGIDSVMVTFDDIPREYASLPLAGDFTRGDNISGVFDAAVLFECDSFERSGLMQYSRLPSINIDHHVSGKEFADINIIDPAASSVCEMLFYAFYYRGFSFSDELARVLFTGMASDTGFFRFSNTTADTFYALMTLTGYNIEINRVYSELYENYSLKRLRLIGHILYTSRYYEEVKTLCAILNREYIETYDIKKTDLEGIINYMLISSELDIAVLIKEFVKDECFVSLRSKETADVGSIAGHFNGGGHRQASGFFMKKPPELAERLLIKEIRKRK